MPIFLPLGAGGDSDQSVDLANLVVETAADSIFVMDTQGRTVFANRAAERTFGWTREELTGKVLHDLVHHHYPDGRPFPMTECPLGNVFASRTTLEKHEELFFHRDGTPIHVACSNAPVLRDGVMVGAVLVAVDITERKRMEQKLAEALAAKEALIKEVHHRVKNSLMMVDGLLRLQAREASDPAVRQHLEEACSRVATAARMHERLYRIEDVESVEFSDFLEELCREITGTCRPKAGVVLEVEAEPMVLPTDRALPLALLANELVTNAIKHAFTDTRTGRIHVRFGPSGTGWELRVADDGVGLPKDFDWTRTRSLGMRLVNALARQVGATLTVERGPGTVFTVRAGR